MSHKKVILILLLVSLCQGAHTSGRDLGVDPGQLLWWQKSWAARPIEVSSSNAQSTSVDLTFKFHTTTALPAGYVVQVYFPSTITAPGNNADNMFQDSFLVSLTADSDSQVTVPGVTLPTEEGAYGPFKVITRAYKDGKIYDISTNFASIYVTTPVTTQTDELTVKGGSDDNNENFNENAEISVLSKLPLTFEVEIDINMWKNDVVVLTVDDNWTLPSSPSCRSIQPTDGTVNYFVSARGDSTLECVADVSKRQILIYGLGTDLDIANLGGDSQSLQLKLKIGEFQAPIADYQYSNYNWTLEVWRQGTKNILKRFTGTGPNTKPGVVQISDIKPHNGYPADELVKGLVLYLDTVYKLDNPIPKNGTVVIQFTGFDIRNVAWKFDVNQDADPTPVSNQDPYAYTEWLQKDISHSLTGTTQMVITANELIEAETVFTTTALASLDNWQLSIQITTYLSDGTIIDQSPVTEVNYVLKGVLKAQGFNVNFGNIDGTNGNNVNNTGSRTSVVAYSKLQLQPGDLKSGTNLTVKQYLPFNMEGESNFSLYLLDNSTNTSAVQLVYSTITSANFSNNEDLTGDNLSNVTVNGELLEIPATIDVGGKSGIKYAIYNNQGGSMSPLYLPQIATNLETRYEVWAVGTTQEDKYVGFKQIGFVSSGFTTPQTRRYCGNLVQIQIITPFTINSNDNDTTFYTLEIGFSQDIGSKLEDGENYPFVSEGSFTNITVTVNETDNKLFIRGQTTYNQSNSHLLYAPIGSGGTYDMSLYYQKYNFYSNIKYEYLSTAAVQAVAIPGSSGYDLTANFSAAVLTASQSITISLGANEVITGLQTNYLVQLPAGFTFEGPTIQITDTSQETATDLKIFQSTNKYFAYPTLFGTADCSTDDCNITANGITTSSWSKNDNSLLILSGNGVAISGDSSGSRCGYNTSDSTVNVTSGTITGFTYTPITVKSRGPGSYYSEFSVVFSLDHGIPYGGKITVVIDANWYPTQTTCSVSGLIDRDQNTKVACNLVSTNTFDITGFEAFDAASTEVSLAWANVLPPKIIGTVTQQRGHLDSVTTYTKDGEIIDQVTSMVDTTCDVTQADDIGISTIHMSKTIPSNAAETDVDLYLRFSFSKDFPAGTILTLTSATNSWTISDVNTKDFVYSSLEFSSVQLTNNYLEFEVAQNVVANAQYDLYVERAVTNPTISPSSGHFKFKATFMDIVMNEDNSSNIDSTYQLIVSSTITRQIDLSTNPVVLDIYSANELANYTFNFSSELAIVETDQIWIQFPLEYDPYIATSSIRYKWNQSNVYYVECDNEKLGDDVECIVDHRFIKVIGLDNVNQNTSVSLTIKGVTNPGETLNSTTGNFKIFQVDSNGSGKAVNRQVPGVTITTLAANIQIKEISVSNLNAFQQGIYEISMYMTQNLDKNEKIQIVLPREYQINLTKNNEPISCNLFRADESGDNRSQFQQISTCATGDNVIDMPLPSSFDEDFTSRNQMIFKVTNLRNPEWGLERLGTNNFVWDFDANDYNVFTVFDIWSGQFTARVYNAQSKTVLARSYHDVNAAYLGFHQQYRGFEVQEFSPIDLTKQIQVYPGSQTKDISISTKNSNRPCAAKKITFTPSSNAYTEDNNKLRFTSKKDKFTMNKNDSSINFRVAAAIDTDKGIYYINWNIDELRQDNLTVDQYDPPVKTLVEVSSTVQPQFTVDTIPVIPINKVSPPIRVWTENAPHTSVTITIAFTDPTIEKIKITPASLEFAYDRNERYFTIQVEEGYSLESQPSLVTIKLEISGVDAEAYQQISDNSITITQSSVETAGNITTFTSLNTTRNQTTLQVESDSIGIYYWYFAPIGSQFPSAEEIANMMDDYFELNSDKRNEEVEDIEVEPAEEDKFSEEYEPWIWYQRRVYREHLGESLYGADVSYTDALTTLTTIEGLFAQTSYKAVCYVKNFSESFSAVAETVIQTPDLPEAASFSLVFDGDVSENLIEKLKIDAAQVVGTSAYRFTDGQRSIQTRLLQDVDNALIKSTTLTWTIPADRSLNTPTPIEEATLTEDQSQLLYSIISAYDMDVTASYSQKVLVKEQYATPQWVYTPTLAGSPTTTSISAYLKTSTKGEACGVCLTNAVQNNSLSATQILIGVNELNQPVPSGCVKVDNPDDSVFVEVEKLSPATAYHCYFMIYNDYPLWPANETEQGAISFQVTTALQEADTQEDNANWLQIALAVLLLVQ